MRIFTVFYFGVGLLLVDAPDLCPVGKTLVSLKFGGLNRIQAFRTVWISLFRAARTKKLARLFMLLIIQVYGVKVRARSESNCLIMITVICGITKQISVIRTVKPKTAN